MFKFGFSNPEEDKNGSEILPEPLKTLLNSIEWSDCEEVHPTREQFDKIEKSVTASVFLSNNYDVGYITSEELRPELTGSLQKAETSHSDLIKGEYEGGFKIWECTHDLADYITRALDPFKKPPPVPSLEDLDNEDEVEVYEIESLASTTFSGKTILDLGCGSGCLGIIAFKAGATVHFQDYNKDVLTKFTIPNLMLNVEEELNENETVEKCKTCKFYSGDWESFTNLIGDGLKYDVILTSETIYNPDNQLKLLNVFKKTLKKGGSVYLAAKVYYFGVGGGIRQFEELVKKDGHFKSEIVWKCETGVQREVLRIF